MSDWKKFQRGRKKGKGLASLKRKLKRILHRKNRHRWEDKPLNGRELV